MRLADPDGYTHRRRLRGPALRRQRPDAGDYGAGDGYPTGDRSTFFRTPFLVGSHSRLDEVFEARRVRRGPTPSALARAPWEPVLRYTFRGETFTLDDYRATRPRGS